MVRSEHHPRITRTCEGCGRDYLCGRHSRWGPCCRWRHRGRKPKKYIWTPERDAYLKARYDGRVKFRAADVAAKLEWPTWQIKKRAAALGLCYPADRRDWTKKEEGFLRWHAGTRTDHWMSKQLRRSLAAVVMKLKHMRISRLVRKGYTLRDLELCFGIDHHGIERWVKEGKLQIRKRHTKRPRDTWYVTEQQILTFLQHHPMAFRLDKVDQRWFMDLVLDGGLIRQALASAKAANE